MTKYFKSRYSLVSFLAISSLLIGPTLAPGQLLPSVSYGSWTDLADGVRYREGSSTSPRWAVQIVEVDLSNPRVGLLPVRSMVSGGYERTSALAQRVDGIAAINGGYFGGGVSYSHFELFDSISSINAASRPPRSTFGIGMENVPTMIRPVGSAGIPVPSDPAWQNVIHAIGGGPRIVTNGAIDSRHVEEGFDAASGVGPTVRHPRTALGLNEDTNTLYLVTVDGRQSTWSVGMTFNELASLMIDIGSTVAMNYDGGGSTTMWADGEVKNRPSDGSERTVTNAWVVVPGYRIDNRDPRFSSNGGWFSSANDGYHLENSLVVSTGSQPSTATWTPNLKEPGRYEVRAWWVAANNRVQETRYTVHHLHGTTTVNMDQTTNGSRFNSLGVFDFEAGEDARVTLTNVGPADRFVSADALEFLFVEDLPESSLTDSWYTY
ncbi:MAG: phosphodiester glycosidase family protein [Candidatus Sumerlaeia bacterium]|nr:phosphodiester glycosidase family protein [Candidatus Sumerlaeia bacterium]